jgi:phage baseplate assembly protein W
MKFYSDINQQDPLVQDKIYDLEDIYQSIHNILNTSKGERLFLPDFGVDLDQYLFEPGTPFVQLQIYEEIAGALRKYEPRIDLVYGKTSFEEIGPHIFDAQIAFTIKGMEYETYMYQSRITPSQGEKFYAVR